MGCILLEVVVNNFLNIFINMFNCSDVQYFWEVGYSDMICDLFFDGSFIYINGMNVSFLQLEIRFIDLGEYILMMIVSNECGEEIYQQIIIVVDGLNG